MRITRSSRVRLRLQFLEFSRQLLAVVLEIIAARVGIINHLLDGFEVLEKPSNGFACTPSELGSIKVTRIETISLGVINLERTGQAECSTKIKKYKVQTEDVLYGHINNLDHIAVVR